MCVACIEYTKNKMTTNELKSALRETTRSDSGHQAEVEKLIRENENPDDLKDKLRKLSATAPTK